MGKCFMMKACLAAIDQRLSDNVLRDDVSKDCRSKKTNVFKVDVEDSADIRCDGLANVELNTLEISS